MVEYRIGDKVTTTQGALVSGAAVNCGEQCTIVQTAETLTVSRAPSRDGTRPTDAVVFLDGRQTTNQTTVTWNGSKLSLVRRFGNIVVTQTISRERAKLMFVSTLSTGNVGSYVLTYEQARDPTIARSPAF